MIASTLIPRTRLFAVLDDALARAAVRVCGGAGVGKSALVTSYVETRGLAHLHIRLDAGDADPFRFIARLDALRAADASARDDDNRTPDPLLAGRHAFARLAASRDVPHVLFLDDHERVPDDAVTQRLLVDALDGLPRGWSVVLVGRGDPPAAFARARASDALVTIDEDALLLTPDECAAVADARASRVLSDAEHAAIARLSGGWAAIVVLLADAPHLPSPTAHAADVPEVVFDYVAEEVYDGLDPTLREHLERLSLAPLITPALVRALDAESGARERLDALARRHFLVDRIEPAEDGPSLARYRLHALFRTFLARRLRRRLDARAVRAAALAAADALDADGEHELAVALRLEHGDTDGAAAAIGRLTPALLADRRSFTALGWFDALPPERVASSATLSLWHGAASMMSDPIASRARLDTAWQLSGRADAPTATFACCVAIETWLLHWDDFHGMDVWIDRLDALLEGEPLPEQPALRSHVICAMVNADLFRRLDAERASRWHERGLAALDEPMEPQVFLMLAQALVVTPMWNGTMTRASIMLDRVRTRVLAGRRVDPLHEMWYRTMESVVRWNLADRHGAEAACERGLACARESGATFLDVLLHYHAGMGCIIDGDADAAAVHAASIADAARSEQLMNVVSHHQLAGALARLRGDLELATGHLEIACERAAAAGLAFAEALLHVGLAFVQLERDDVSGALDRNERARAIAARLGLTLVELDIRVLEAWRADRDGERERALAAVTDAFAIARRDGRVASVWWSRPMLSRLCALALENDVETDHVTRIVSLHRLDVPSEHVHLERWPRRVTVRLLGAADIVVDGERVASGGRAGARPLELVRALATLGGRVEASALADLLWPDADGGAAMDAFKTTLARARRRLGVDGALVLADGHLSLDRRLCWCDVAALAALDRQARALAAEEAADDASRRRVDDAIIALYRGDLLPGERASWSAEPRRRARERWLRAVLRRGAALEGRGEFAAAARLHESAIERSPDVEALYRLAMQAHLRAGSPEAGRLIAERCERQLARLGRVPDESTRAIGRALESPAPTS